MPDAGAFWVGLRAPGLEEFEVMARTAWDDLPEGFRRLAGDILIRIADFPDDDVLDELEASSPFDLLGLFQGVGLAHDGGVPQTGQMPNMIWLYRRPILDYWADNDDTLDWIVRHVLVHEIGHHFGLSDDDMEAIEAAAEADSRPA